ncbi:DUF882 domain-containing protein [Magnetospirillum sulfuroxidans]|uniref:Murein endopeptidase K n=1 Tax=Magnetospirillum sulfuroxidans TaxID=611300 RepID=A0ABS5ICI1_9PROT|nr:DUF882 domain-containing protein [Magnetospirillum sulfuroxidans]MBR9972130.1 DUF882 domain-containing protein [Magnetospirillum sulfuroxidans]
MNQDHTGDRTLSRRLFLGAGIGAAATMTLTSPLEAAVRAMPERALNLYNIHTGEWLKTVYWADGRYIAKSLAQVSHLLRDHRSDDDHPMDPRLLDLIAATHRRLGSKGAIHIISGYRSPATNALLAAATDGVAQGSLHMSGKAVDIRIPGTTIRTVGRAAKSLRGGGVGTYLNSKFVHVDTGRIRYW